MSATARGRVSVVVPTLDTRELTLACVASVLASRLPEGTALEVVVVDDGSTDGTAESIRGLSPAVKVLRNEAPTGYARAVNAGAAATDGDVLVLLNSDTEVDADGLASVLAAFESRERLGVAGASLVYPGGEPQWSGGHAPTLPWLFLQASGLPPLLGRLPAYRRVKPLHVPEERSVDWVPGAALAIRRDAWRRCGPLDTSYRLYAQDLDLCLRVGAAGWEVRVLPGFRVVHHHGATIARDGASGVRMDAGVLWSDLVLWASRQGGERRARSCRRALWAGSGLRLLSRRLLSPLVPAARREEWRRGTRELAAARRALEVAPPRP